MMYGYARVSAAGQHYAAQVDELRAAGCERIFSEKASAAAGRKRPALRQAVAALEAGDVLVVTRLNRLARSARDALNVLDQVRARGADFKSLREAWADTTTAHGRLVVTILSGLAEFDREMILERTGEGRTRAKANGVRFGRPPILTGRQLAYIRARRQETPPASIGDLREILGVSRATIVRACAKVERGELHQAEPAPPVWHAPTCAFFEREGRCTCGGAARPSDAQQIDVEELIALAPRA